MKFNEDYLKVLQVIEWTRFFGKVLREINQKISMHELWLLHSAIRLMLIGIYMKCLEDILNSFQFKEQAQFVIDICMKFHKVSLDGF